ncbi:hypothetical protein G7B40_021100 [Aetokthonos hydrillicola Thurmond2011]|jgi:hypothetical protein|uniref:Uncharacterized protein n=2 Tax=Aetokthonos TaxID=1550243 RepID=A0AAP5I8Y0_9CYAN|nr:hypothetical protein [Aetokthonos hydrillicola]MBO3458649.1 hypothetical protein [Aetokthonos hydrillicola CCALA 1050]MBW4588002.1 hypothetical protein [Aetokthonos hydrillicola CCALA 1050]MDR9897046.1 hypothetical protein [Aetokthonos hydrillicola Thurmond2011]
MANLQEFRTSILAKHGANNAEVEELLTYNKNIFDHSILDQSIALPLTPEAHIPVWEEYVQKATEIGAYNALKQYLVQLQFPIQKDISQTETYRAATRKGICVGSGIENSGLSLQQPDKLELILYPSLAGTIPVLLTSNRDDFISLVQALTFHNEPQTIPASMGACTVSGFNNWDRIHRYRQQWEKLDPKNCSNAAWSQEFRQIIPRKELYQDRFMILSTGSYSNVTASELGLSREEWQKLSLKIRLEHESTHYFTYRLFHSMRNNLLDELIADYIGIVAAIGYYRADWFLRFLGLEVFPNYREGGRLQNYRGKPPLSNRAFQVLQSLTKAAAEQLENFDTKYANKPRDPYIQALILMSLSYLTLEELASPEANVRIQYLVDKLQKIHPQQGQLTLSR